MKGLKTCYLLFKEFSSGIEEFFEKHDLVPLYFIILALAYITAFFIICIGWYIYEWVTLGHLNQNGDDTLTALEWSLVLMLPIVDLYLNLLNKQLKG